MNPYDFGYMLGIKLAYDLGDRRESTNVEDRRDQPLLPPYPLTEQYFQGHVDRNKAQNEQWDKFIEERRRTWPWNKRPEAAKYWSMEKEERARRAAEDVQYNEYEARRRELDAANVAAAANVKAFGQQGLGPPATPQAAAVERFAVDLPAHQRAANNTPAIAPEVAGVQAKYYSKQPLTAPTPTLEQPQVTLPQTKAAPPVVTPKPTSPFTPPPPSPGKSAAATQQVKGMLTMNPYDFGYMVGVKSAAGPYAGPTSNTAFDAAHAAATLGMRPNAPPQLVYNNMMNKFKNNQFTPAQFSAFNQKYGGKPPAFSQPAPAPAGASTGAMAAARPPQPAPQAGTPASPGAFDPTRTAATLGMRPNAPPQLVYNRMMHMQSKNQLTPAQFSALNQQYGNKPPAFPQSTPAAMPRPQTTPRPAGSNPSTLVTSPRPQTPATAPRSQPATNRLAPNRSTASLGPKRPPISIQ